MTFIAYRTRSGMQIPCGICAEISPKNIFRRTGIGNRINAQRTVQMEGHKHEGMSLMGALFDIQPQPIPMNEIPQAEDQQVLMITPGR